MLLFALSTKVQSASIQFNETSLIRCTAFPKQLHGGTLYDEWPTCASYIADAVHLSRKFREYQGPNSKVTLDAPKEFVELLSNASW